MGENVKGPVKLVVTVGDQSLSRSLAVALPWTGDVLEVCAPILLDGSCLDALEQLPQIMLGHGLGRCLRCGPRRHFGGSVGELVDDGVVLESPLRKVADKHLEEHAEGVVKTAHVADHVQNRVD